MKPSGRIGLFDSGVGGLTIFRDIIARLPQYDYVYVGDTLHKPYGSKPASEIRGYIQNAMPYFFDQGCEIIIITCNTATAQALRFIQQQYLPKYAPHRYALGVIVPAAEAAVMTTKTNAIGVLATQGTIDTQVFATEIQKLRPQTTVYEQAAPELVSLIEAGLHRSEEMKMMLRHYLQSLKQTNVDTLILGCTHYELIPDLISEVLGPKVTLIHQGPVVAERLQDYLFRHPELSHKLVQGGERRIVFTSHAQAFSLMSKEFFGAPVNAEDVTL